MPFKANAARRHQIPRQRHQVTNWAEYDAALSRRGSLTVWFTEEALTAWRAEPRTTPGRQRWYSPLAILTALTLRAVFRLALRQAEGLIGAILRLLGLDLAVPDQQLIAERGRMGWQKASGSNCRALAEAAISRCKRVIGDVLRSRMDRVLELGRPKSVRIA